MNKTKLGINTTLRRCKKCSWCAAYTNWVPFGAPKLPDTRLCTCPKVAEITPDCSWFDEPCKDEDED